MDLSRAVAKSFAEVANKVNENKKEGVTYATIVEYNDTLYAKLDGSSILTPISSTVNITNGDRVIVMLRNHVAVITGNLSDPSASGQAVTEIDSKVTTLNNVVADKVNTKELEAEKARIDSLEADNVTVNEKLTAVEADIGTLTADNATINGKLTAAEADIDNLTADNATINGKISANSAEIGTLKSEFGDFKQLTTNNFTATNAEIENLKTEKLSAEQADLRYANIEFSNIGDAAIENLYAKSGVIENLVVENGTVVTGELVGVTIKGDLIEGGTVKADKLVILGEDGLYYKLNVNALGETTAASDPKYQNGLDGSVIVAKSITAEKVNVHDLVAFDATIGGFNISDSSIYSGAKESVTNGTRGIYLDKNGQISFGDADNFIRYYKDTDGTYKLEISAANISIKSGGEGSNLNDEISNIKNDVNSLRGEIASEEIRYYLLQSSTLAAPEKPTTYPPPSTWATTEPIYSNPDNDPDTLYFVTCTVYANGTFKYSDVLISSTYESFRSSETRINQTMSSIDFSITEQINTVRTDYKTYTDNALNNYVTNADYTEDKKNTDDKMSDIEDDLSNKATKDDLNGFATSEQYNEIRKYITFTKDGIKISSDSTYDNPDAKHLTLTLDNEAIKFENNGVVIGRWDGTNFYTGDMVVKLNQRAQFGNFAFVPRSDKSLMFLKVQD